eukprot:1160853-Pelagomonas_calceolata.AAC.3
MPASGISSSGMKHASKRNKQQWREAGAALLLVLALQNEAGNSCIKQASRCSTAPCRGTAGVRRDALGHGILVDLFAGGERPHRWTNSKNTSWADSQGIVKLDCNGSVSKPCFGCTYMYLSLMRLQALTWMRLNLLQELSTLQSTHGVARIASAPASWQTPNPCVLGIT